MDDDTPGFLVESDRLPNGSYAVTIHVGQDDSWTLDRDGAVAHAVGCIANATAAEHDAAVVGSLTAAGIELEAAGWVIKGLRADRPEQAATRPMRFEPQLGMRVGPFLKMYLHDKEIGEVTPADLVDHAMGVLKVLAAADLDHALRTALVGTIGIDQDTAAAMVFSLRDHWPPEQPHPAANAPAGI